MASVAPTPASPTQSPSRPLDREDQTLLLFARLMEGGQEDDETAKQLDQLTRLLNDDTDAVKKGGKSITGVIDADCVDTILGYLDMRQPEIVRGHATLTTSAYLKAAGDDGNKKLTAFFNDRVQRGTYDDYIVAFCVAATIFPIVPDLTSELFLSEGFLPSLGPLMRRKWKSRKVETACLEMLNAACMHAKCREAVQKYCSEWLEEIVDQDPEAVVKSMYAADPDVHVKEGSISMRRHSEHVQNLAAVVLTKIRAVQAPQAAGEGPRVQQATTSVEDLSRMFTKMLLKDPESAHNSIEGLAYASIQSVVKEQLASDDNLLKNLVKTLEKAPAKSPLTYGTLSIFVNLTRYQPVRSEEEKKMEQLKAYANAAGKLRQDPLNDDEHVAKRCRRVFDAGLTPVLVAHSKNGSVASLSLVIAIIFSLSVTPALRGQLAQQGAVRLLIAAWNALPAATEPEPRRRAAQALARILITTNPALVFGGTRPTPQSGAIRPLASIVAPADTAAMGETRDLLPTFEALMALTNLASTDDDTRASIVRSAWDDVEEQLLSGNARVATAAAELVCNLVQGPEAAARYADGSLRAANRLHVLVALADAESPATRSAAGGALASLTGVSEDVVRAVASLDRGAAIVLGLCVDSASEDLRHRGAVVAYNLVAYPGEAGRLARRKVRDAGGLEKLKECAKMSRRPEVVEIAVQALRLLLEEEKT